jgi:hypothetical protein
MREAVRVVGQFQTDQSAQLREVVERGQFAVVHGEVLEGGAALDEVPDGRGKGSDWDPVEAELVDSGRLPRGLDATTDLALGVLWHWNLKELSLLL